jgi:psp operon transcriptional activator
VLTVPPLRARTGDVMQLAEHFAVNISRELGRDLFAGFSESARAALIGYPWPGNVRELKNVVERSVHRTPADDAVDTIVFDPFASAFRPAVDAEPEAIEAMPPPPASIRLPCDIKAEMARMEIDLVQRALAEARYSQVEAAPLLGLGYHQLRALLRKHGMVKSRRRRDRP